MSICNFQSNLSNNINNQINKNNYEPVSHWLAANRTWSIKTHCDRLEMWNANSQNRNIWGLNRQPAVRRVSHFLGREHEIHISDFKIQQLFQTERNPLSGVIGRESDVSCWSGCFEQFDLSRNRFYQPWKKGSTVFCFVPVWCLFVYSIQWCKQGLFSIILVA